MQFKIMLALTLSGISTIVNNARSPVSMGILELFGFFIGGFIGLYIIFYIIEGIGKVIKKIVKRT